MHQHHVSLDKPSCGLMSKYTLISSLKVDSSSVFKAINKLTHPPVTFVVFLTVGDEDVVFVSWNEA